MRIHSGCAFIDRNFWMTRFQSGAKYDWCGPGSFQFFKFTIWLDTFMQVQLLFLEIGMGFRNWLLLVLMLSLHVLWFFWVIWENDLFFRRDWEICFCSCAWFCFLSSYFFFGKTSSGFFIAWIWLWFSYIYKSSTNLWIK